VTVRKIAARARVRGGSLPRHFSLVIAIVVAPVLVALVVGGSLMVVGREAALVAALVAVAGLVAIVAARLVAGGILRDVQAMRDGLTAVGRGRRDIQIVTSARDELAELAAAANAMIVQLRDEEAARDHSDAARRI
jgi:methyl-accepting chemotaxis protein